MFWLLKFNEMLLNKLIAVQAECQGVREANILILKGIAKFPEGQTPQLWVDAMVQKAKTELEADARKKLAAIMAGLRD